MLFYMNHFNKRYHIKYNFDAYFFYDTVNEKLEDFVDVLWFWSSKYLYVKSKTCCN